MLQFGPKKKEITTEAVSCMCGSTVRVQEQKRLYGTKGRKERLEFATMKGYGIGVRLATVGKVTMEGVFSKGVFACEFQGRRKSLSLCVGG